MHGDALTAIRALAEVEYKIHSRPGAFVKLEPEMDGWMFPSVPLQMTNSIDQRFDSQLGRAGEEDDQRTSHDLIAKSASPNSSWFRSFSLPSSFLSLKIIN